MNRLAQEKSPYLLQHKGNPVDWYPWGSEAFEKAAREDKPVFLSIGYSTCHWCHVMEEESFENPQIAELINRLYVPIKVDREERPDIDKIYMSYVMAFTGSGGWPMTVFLTPGAKPFYGGTYFPPEGRYGRPGLPQVLEHLSDAWKNERQRVIESSDEAVGFLEARAEGGETIAGPDLLYKAFEQFVSGFDPIYGGFGRAPKFPSGHALSFLIKYYLRTRSAGALEMAEKTLGQMARGGMYDQIGGGFHRYSTDAQWRVPHFEKMLYDQALLLKAYCDAFRVTGNPFYEKIARETADYVLREMTSPEGAFYSAEDADSPDPDRPGKKREGAFFVWKSSEIDTALGADAGAFKSAYGVETKGNALVDPQGEFVGYNILYAANIDPAQEPQLARGRRALFDARSKRPRPHLDDKILADWNGLMIESLAIASVLLAEPRYRDAAVLAADFVFASMHDEEGRLWHRWRDGEAAVRGQHDDHAFLAAACLALYEATFDDAWLSEAKNLCDAMLDRFWDEERGGFYMTPSDGEALVTRPKESHDGAIPSGNSVAALVLLQMAAISGGEVYEARGRQTIAAFSESMQANPTAHAQMLSALQYAIGPSYEIVVAEADDGAFEKMLDAARRAPLPSRVVLGRKADGNEGRLAMIAPFTREQKPVGGRSTAYICRDKACQTPISDPVQFKETLAQVNTIEA